MAHRVAMTGMPQMVGLLNAFGGIAAALEGIALYFSPNAIAFITEEYLQTESVIQVVFMELGIFIGTVTFVGSIIACMKLNGSFRKLPGCIESMIHHQRFWNIFILVISVILMVLSGLSSYYESCIRDVIKPVISVGQYGWIFNILLVVFSVIYGFVFVLPIGGADMPVVISVLNAFSGISGCTAGFMLQNSLLIITGAIVASSGCILSYIMCQSMNRSLMNVLAGGFGEGAVKTEKKEKKEEPEKPHFPIEPAGVADLLVDAKKILIVPGYGMAVGHAQHAVSEMTTILRGIGKEVSFGIHPVAGRLPGHMNVLLAEANVPYNIIYEMEEVNPSMKENDVCLVIGANDTVNPAAENDPESAIAGMPVIRVWDSKRVVVFKRSMNKGYADVENPLFFYENTNMCFGNAKDTIEAIVTALREKTKDLQKSVAEAGVAVAKQDDSFEFDKYETFMTVGVPKEEGEEETRVAVTPSAAIKMRKLGFKVLVQHEAGAASKFDPKEYEKVGVTLLSREEIFKQADVILKMNEPLPEEVELLRENQILVSYASPAQNTDLLKTLADKKVKWLAMDNVPRTTTAQKLDSLSSMGKIAGYRAVIEACSSYEGFFAPQITAAGKFEPCKMLIIGAGVAGLEAIGAAKALGADVRCFDTRSVCREQVESMGGTFLDLKVPSKESGEGAGGYAKVMSPEYIAAEMDLFLAQARECNVIISTAAIPGKRAPILLEERHVDAMKTGSVIVDLAARTGGNCVFTEPGKVVVHNGVTIIGYKQLSCRMSRIASEMYANNLFRLLEHMGGAKEFKINVDDDIIRSMLVCSEGEVTYPPKVVNAPAPIKAVVKKTTKSVAVLPQSSLSPNAVRAISVVALIVVLALVGFLPPTFTRQLMVFALSCIIGYNSIWNVTPALHTPLMSVTNAISGVVVLGALFQAIDPVKSISFWISMVAVVLAAVNVGGGFYVTRRMLSMFKKM